MTLFETIFLVSVGPTLGSKFRFNYIKTPWKTNGKGWTYAKETPNERMSN